MRVSGVPAMPVLSTRRVTSSSSCGPSTTRAVLPPGATPVLGNWYRVPVPVGQTPLAGVEAMARSPLIQRAELDYVVTLPEISMVEAEAPASSVNDPLFRYQWHFPAVQADSAWSAASGSGVVVAVVDTGISHEGEDLSCRPFVDPYNAITDTASLAAANDDHGHGTHVAGTIAQCTNNGVGVAGVAFGADLMPVKVLNQSGTGLMSDIAEGIDWARTHGADVINLSLGCDGCSSSILDEAIEQAAADGIVIVAASGNSSSHTVSYPASHPDVIAVGATGYSDAKAPYSNTGNALDLVAPGGDLNQDANGDGFGDGVLQETFVVEGVDKVFGYYFSDGTSMAAPHVAAAAAMLLSISPGIDPATVEEILETTALDLGAAGFDTTYGHGLLQIQEAIDYLLEPDAEAPAWPSGAKLNITSLGGTAVGLGWPKATDDRAVVGYEIYKDGGLLRIESGSTTTTTVTGLVSAETYQFGVRAVDAAGNRGPLLEASATTLDTVAPTWPAGASVRVTRYGERSLVLAWDAAADNVAVTQYRLRLENTWGFLLPGTLAEVTGLQPGTPYVFEVLARDAAGNWSGVLTGLVRTGRSFVDTVGHTFYEDVLWMSGRDITRGCNPPVNDRFCPDDPVTRGQLAAFLVRALGLEVNTHPGFVDVPAGSTFAGDIGRLATAGITRGCNPPVNDRFCPDDPVTRGQLAAFLHRGLD